MEKFDNILDQQLCFEVYKAASNFQRLYTEILKPYALTFPQYLVLLALYEKQPILAKDISARLGIGIGTLNPILTRMINNDWIEKKQSDTDKRSYHLFLTDKAKSSKASIKKAIEDKITSCDLIDQDTILLMNQMKQLNDKLQHTL